MILFLIILSILVFIILFLPLILGIPLVYFTLRLNNRHEIIPCEEKDLPHSGKDFFSTSGKELLSLGFSHISYYKHKGVTNSADAITYTGFFYNPERKVSASVMYAIQGEIKNSHIELSSKFVDGSHVSTYNSTGSSPFIYPPHIIMRKMKIKNTEELFHDHLMAVEKLKGSAMAIDADVRQYAHESNEEVREIMSYQVEKGLMRVCDDGVTVGPTFTGAITMVIKEWILCKWLRLG